MYYSFLVCPHGREGDCGVSCTVYLITCSQFNEEYIGETGRPLWALKKVGTPKCKPNKASITIMAQQLHNIIHLDGRIREIVKLSDNQCGLVSGCGTIDAIPAARLLASRETEAGAYRLSRLGKGLRPRTPVAANAVLLSEESSQAAAVTSVEFAISAGVHQGSALSPLLFVVVMDATRDLQKAVPCTLYYADDMMLACDDKDDLERQMQAWCDRLAEFGFKNVKKTNYITSDVKSRVRLH
ncbi:unnamed protein product [Heligmosomoides polygyrus]|uniref:Reverse transcriptase domain-containing protein n=1 Tax=Heligmosomoides polygyrus TaxID=6339 RepID=A0A183FRF9_HELPZ|nr:unnamed protein product [Heligmosomoides polygyrus]